MLSFSPFLIGVLFATFGEVKTLYGEGDEYFYDKYDGKPAFHAYVKGNRPFSGNDILKFDEVLTNIGNYYDPLTGQFTAPKTGLYQIACTIQGHRTSGVTFQIQKNNERFDLGYAGGRDWHAVTRVLLMQLKEGDKVFVQHRIPHRKETVAGNRHSYFSGRLLQ
ncbi:C1QL [Mytilus edulis]|uniref:C1QL n=1 Tax=Mytilus edulis TaxID=6550 RepID=A0A8S3SZ66_MYTED|nr:C1QL [Mytilus edulis]